MPKEVRHIPKEEIREIFNREIQPQITNGKYRAYRGIPRDAPPKICATHGAGTTSLMVEIKEVLSGKFVADCHVYVDPKGVQIGQLDPKTAVVGDVMYKALGDHAYIGG